ncbi:MAG TPA: glycosyltransferase family 4 protein [Mycobacteriales bacterium]|nr:glycosyltransferase family 4 protein [Mycobacteriales bacterium]
MDDTHVLTVSLLTLGDPATMTGGYLYHRRMQALAPDVGARVRFAALPAGAFPRAALAGGSMLRAVARERPDVLVLDSIAAAPLAPWLPWWFGARGPRIPLVGMLHQPPGGIDFGPTGRAVRRALDRSAYRFAARLLVASDALAAQLRADGVGDDRIRVVPPGRDVAAPGEGRQEGTPPRLREGRRAAVLSVGNWVRRKGLLDLLDAVARLPADAVTLHLVGDPGVEPGYASLVRARLTAPDLAGRVVVHGPLPVERVAAYYRAADVFALASVREPYGTVYGEAMAAGVPVVGWRAGNLPFLARDGVEGLVVPPGDVPGLAAALLRLADDEELRRSLGAAAARRAAGFPTWRETARRLFAELRAVVAERRRSRRR